MLFRLFCYHDHEVSVILQMLDDMLDYLKENDDVYIGWSIWAAGPSTQ
jgi:hypothetical protein